MTIEQNNSDRFNWGCGEKKWYKMRWLVVGVLVVAAIAVAVTRCLQMKFSNTTSDDGEKSQDNEYREMIEGLNRNVDPCEDFHKFACSGWISTHPVSQKPPWRQAYLPMEVSFENMHGVLEDPDLNDDQDPTVKMARGLYKKCMDAEIGDKSGLTPIFDLFARLGLSRQPPSFNGPTNDTEIDLDYLVGAVRRHLGIDVFVYFSIILHSSHRNQHRMMIERKYLHYHEYHFINRQKFRPMLIKFKHEIKETMELAGLTSEDSKSFADEIVDFESRLAQIMIAPENSEKLDEPDLDMTVRKLQNLTDETASIWNWTKYLEAVFEDTDVILDFDKDRVIVKDLEYLQKLVRLLSTTPRAIIVPFVWWNIFAGATFWVHNKKLLKKERGKFSKGVSCADTIILHFELVLENFYTQRNLDQKSKKKVEDMIRNLRATFEKMAIELNWMDKATQVELHQKLYTMRPSVDFPILPIHLEQINELYKEMQDISGEYLEIFLRMMDMGQKKSLNLLREIPYKIEWSARVIYDALGQSSLYGNRPESINYGGLGALIGHEIIFDFHDQRDRYDENGHLHQWWSNKTLDHYHKKVECFIKQYESYRVPELSLKINGYYSRDEYIADNGGIRVAYRAYQKLKSTGLKEQAPPGLSDYTQDQLFFISYAQSWCRSFNKGITSFYDLTDNDPLNRFRVIATLSNHEEFSEAWKCRIESRMNPLNKCKIW